MTNKQEGMDSIPVGWDTVGGLYTSRGGGALTQIRGGGPCLLYCVPPTPPPLKGKPHFVTFSTW